MPNTNSEVFQMVYAYFDIRSNMKLVSHFDEEEDEVQVEVKVAELKRVLSSCPQKTVLFTTYSFSRKFEPDAVITDFDDSTTRWANSLIFQLDSEQILHNISIYFKSNAF